MGKRLRKAALLEEIVIERAALDDAIASLGPRDMTRAGVTPGGWSVKDIIAHVVDWQDRTLGWYEAGLRGERPAVPGDGFTMRELPLLNQAIWRRHRRRSLKAVLDDYRAYHQRMLVLIDAVDENDMVTLNRWSWTGPSWTLSDYIRAQTASHYRWARKHIRRWSRTRSTDTSGPA
jgi:hypothetical protein